MILAFPLLAAQDLLALTLTSKLHQYLSCIKKGSQLGAFLFLAILFIFYDQIILLQLIPLQLEYSQ